MKIKLKLSNKIFLFGIFFLSGFLIGFSFAQNQNCPPYKVTKIIDGDTIEVKIKNKIEKVRLLGIDTPEIEGPYTKKECFGKEASQKTKEILKGKRVYLIGDPQAKNRDKYGRLLRYVFLENGEFVNALLIKEGYAFQMSFEPFLFEDYFEKLEKKAKKERKGLWSEKCNYFKLKK